MAAGIHKIGNLEMGPGQMGPGQNGKLQMPVKKIYMQPFAAICNDFLPGQGRKNTKNQK